MIRTPLLVFALALAGACKDATDDPGTDSVPEDSLGNQDSGGAEDLDGDGFSAEEDCDDSNPAVNPGAAEVCDSTDNNCDGAVDEGVQSSFYTDADGDGYGAGDPVLACEAPDGMASQGGDCDDGDDRFHPGADESDCADPNDYNCDGSIGYADGDGDGYAACEECDDGNVAINPAAVEVCDSIDNNCDGSVDEGVSSTWYQDADADGYGDVDYATDACEPPEGYVADAADCDDTQAAVNPAATEVCDGTDNDCDTLVDDADDSLDLSTATAWTTDADGDGYGAGSAGLSCAQPSGTSERSGDCDDADAAISPSATEICDGADNDCDGSVDGADPSLDSGTASTWYADSDGDGYGDPASSTLACEAPSGFVSDATDCDDTEAASNPGEAEVCDDLDNDCDGALDDDDPSLDSSSTSRWYADSDGDGYGDPASSVRACDRPSGYRANLRDCDDTDAAVSPAATELCNFVDDDCDGTVDDGLPDTDSSGLADCKEVAVVASYGFQLRGGSYTCDGVAPVQSEFSAIDAALGDMGLAGVLVYEDVSAGFADSTVSGYGAVILHNGGWSDAWRTASDTSIAALYAAGVPVLLMGDDGVYNVSNTATAAGTTTMWDITRTASFVGNGGRNGTISVNSAASTHPIAVGDYGSVGSFTYIADLDYLTLAGLDETAVMSSSYGYPVIWAAEDASTGQRTVVFLPSLYNSHDCPISDTAGLAELEVVFKNSVDWAMGW